MESVGWLDCPVPGDERIKGQWSYGASLVFIRFLHNNWRCFVGGNLSERLGDEVLL